MGVGLRSTISRETTTSPRPQFAMRLQCHDPKVPSKPLRVDGGEGRGLSLSLIRRNLSLTALASPQASTVPVDPWTRRFDTLSLRPSSKCPR